MRKLLEIKDLQIDFQSGRGHTRAVDGISLELFEGETLGIVGESGSGKSVTALSVMQLLPAPPARQSTGQILYQPQNGAPAVDLLALPPERMRAYRGAEIGMIFQEPMSSLNPVMRCGHQITEAVQLHTETSFEAAKELTIKLFEQVKLPDPARIFKAYPHEISGGQKQRVMIAMALSCNPAILIADEPTTALDVTVQKAILDLMRGLKAERNLSMLFISHDLGVISEICDRVAVMYQGKMVESGSVNDIMRAPQHPYTKGLIRSRPSLHRKLQRLPTVPDFLEGREFEAHVVNSADTEQRRAVLYEKKPVLQVENLLVRYPARKNRLGATSEWFNAVDRVSFEVYEGETFGLAGESGCGKTTLGRSIARLIDPADGEIRYKDANLLSLDDEAMRPFRREIQMVFQDPYASLNPRMTIGAAIEEPMEVHKLHENRRNRRDKTVHLLETVGLKSDHYQRYPHEFSGGQRQRICIARALALEPRFLICDEIVSALDVSVQATVLNLLLDLREQFGLSYIFISHDLSVIKQMCDRLLVMNRGKAEALGYPEMLYERTDNEYLARLISAIPGKDII